MGGGVSGRLFVCFLLLLLRFTWSNLSVLQVTVMVRPLRSSTFVLFSLCVCKGRPGII